MREKIKQFFSLAVHFLPLNHFWTSGKLYPKVTVKFCISEMYFQMNFILLTTAKTTVVSGWKCLFFSSGVLCHKSCFFIKYMFRWIDWRTIKKKEACRAVYSYRQAFNFKIICKISKWFLSDKYKRATLASFIFFATLHPPVLWSV